MDTYIVSLLFFFTALFVCVTSQTCEQSHYENCLNKLLLFTDRGNLQFGSTAVELDQECVQARAALHCLTTYTKRCLPLENRTQFLDGISGPERVTVGLCTVDEVKTNYLNSLPCLRNISDGLEYCKEKYERNQKDIFLVEYEDKTHLQCCSFDGYRRCLRMVIETQAECRASTAEFLNDLAERIGGSLTQGSCSEHFERCTGSSSAKQNHLSTLSSFIVAFAIGMSLM